MSTRAGLDNGQSHLYLHVGTALGRGAHLGVSAGGQGPTVLTLEDNENFLRWPRQLSYKSPCSDVGGSGLG